MAYGYGAISPRFLCRLTAFIKLLNGYSNFIKAVKRQRNLGLWRYVFTENLFCKIFVTNISGRLGSFSRLMASLQRRGQINHLQIQSVLYFSLREKTGSSLTLCHPSTNAPNIIKLLNISWGDQSVLLTAFTQDFLFFTSLGKIKKTDTVLFSSTVLPI